MPLNLSDTNALLGFLLLLIIQFTSGARVEDCGSKYCGEIEIKFPFGLKGDNQGRRCTYPTFEVSCNDQSQTILMLPKSEDLVIKSIDYGSQTIMVNDPDQCLPRRFLQKKLNLSDSPFRFDPSVYHSMNLTFLRCPSNTTLLPVPPVYCLNDLANSSFSVIYTWRQFMPEIFSECEVINSSVPYPISNLNPWPFSDIVDDIQLTWGEPRCGRCEARGEDCGFRNDTSPQIGCVSRPQESSGLPRSVKYGLTIGVGIPGLTCLIGLGCFLCGKVRRHRHPRPSIEFPISSFVVQSVPFRMGLDGSTIEKYPKTLLGESGRLPRPNDNTCSVCLSDYQPKETLRTIPDCNHYFHAHCIDEWLKMNATCPVCRNSPALTPSSTASRVSHSSSESSSR